MHARMRRLFSSCCRDLLITFLDRRVRGRNTLLGNSVCGLVSFSSWRNTHLMTVWGTPVRDHILLVWSHSLITGWRMGSLIENCRFSWTLIAAWSSGRRAPVLIHTLKVQVHAALFQSFVLKYFPASSIVSGRYTKAAICLAGIRFSRLYTLLCTQ